jgi:hypothetical protein
MKTNKIKWLIAAVLLVGSTLLFSFGPKGGDSFQIFLNGKLLHQQYVHMDKNVKTLEITSASATDKLDIYYSHCGQIGKERFITVKDEKGHPLKVWQFLDGTDAGMSIMLKDVPGFEKNSKLRIFYASREIPNGKQLATLRASGEGIARK